MKRIYLTMLYFGIALLSAGCGGSGGSSAGSTPLASKVSITAGNADTVAKGANSSSQTMVKQGTTGASALGVVVESSAATGQSVLDIALAQLKRVEGITLPAAPAGVTGVISNLPITNNCTTTGTVVFDIVDTDNSTTFTVGDVAKLTFNACKEPNSTATGYTTTNGTMSLTINSASGSGTSVDPLNESVTMGFTSFTVDESAPAETLSIDGGMTLAINNDGKIMTASMSGSSFSVTSSNEGAFTLKNFDVNESVTVTTSVYSFSENMTINCALLGGEITITTPTAFTGIDPGNPTAGVMRIDGANNSYMTLTAQSDGVHVDIVVNDGTNASQPVLTKTVTWDQL